MRKNYPVSIGFLSLLLFIALVFPQDGLARTSPKKTEVTIGLKYMTNIAERGAIFYKNWQVLPVIYFGFFNNRLQFLGNKLEYNDYLFEDVVRGRTGFQYFDDNFFLKTGADRTVRNSRPSTFEWINTLEFFLPNYFDNIVTMKMFIAYDLDEHNGIYGNFDLAASVVKFWGDDALALVEPQIFANIGFGDGKHNQYMYGSNITEAAITDFAVGLRIVSPIKYDRHYPSFELYYFSIFDDVLKNGNLLVGDTEGYRAELTLAVNLL